ncbi:response regulator [Chitinispirillales bacterium ANBcel5]|uniref:HD domain-containing phosphohydrolase n=1 Tax=Cellulosispirillum alkaliphilum TaxID=3039283 RepID=UPI002A5306E7|nr:response regulator [Chitinispirillales bacterium ANBcel5]
MSNDSKQILITDDEETICDVLSQFLQGKGYAVYTACSAQEAIETIQSKQIDLMVTDIQMPGMSGVDLLKWINCSGIKIPVLMTTGYPSIESAIEGLKLGAFDYLTKPFHLEEIGEKVRRAFLNREIEEENLLFSKLVSLHEITKVLATTLDLDELNRKFIDYSIKITKGDGGVLLLQNAASKLSVSAMGGTIFERAFWLSSAFKCASKWVMEREEPLVMEAGKEVGLGLYPVPPQLRSYIVFPLKTPTRIIGVLILIRFKDRLPFSNLDLEILNVLTSQASISIENAKLYQSSRNNYLKTIKAFALAVEAKDKYTHGHSENVMKYTVILARHLGLSESAIELVKYAGLLHDIGKIGISELIINKPGRLTLEEFEQIKRHPELGARILSDVPSLKELVPFVLHHHEFYCGGGYPSGLKGDQIPFGARILSVADAFEAMTSDRPYRKSLSKEVAFGILLKERGRQFDPVVVDAFLEII